MKKLIATVALVASLSGVSLLATAAPASASAYGCNGWGQTWAGNYWAPSGGYCVLISGQGRFVSYVQGSYGASNICNTRITAEFFTDSWQWYRTYNSATWGGCSTNRTQTIYINGYVPYTGWMCSTLYSNNTRLTSVCHLIKSS
jgi:hypothetical protein